MSEPTLPPTPWQRQLRWLRTHLDTPSKRAGAAFGAAAVLGLLIGAIW